jgi:hypothetical protein
MNRLKFDIKKRRYIYIFICLVIGLIDLIIALQISPWFNALNTRVRFYFEASSETKIGICWDQERTQCLPLVPYSTARADLAQPGDTADMWLSELPPRPVYSISIIFDSAVHEAIFHELDLDSSPFLGLGYQNGGGIESNHFGIDQFRLQGLSGSNVEGIYNFEIKPNSQLILNRQIAQDSSVYPFSILIVWGLLFSISMLMVVPIYFLARAVQNLRSSEMNDNSTGYPWWIYLICGVPVISMPFLVFNSGVIINEYDPMGYLYLAMGGGWFNEMRLPGYPLFLGFIFKLFGYSLNKVIFLQASILAFSVLICIWALRKWIPPYIGILFAFLCLLSPAQIYWARWILRESLFASLVLLGVTAVIAHFTSPKPFSIIWFFIFTIICGFTFLVRENGLLLPIILIPVLVPKIIKHVLTLGPLSGRVRSVIILLLQYSSPFLMIAIIYIAFSWYNYVHYGYFQIGIHQISHSNLVKAIYSANSDARSLLNPGLSVSEEAKPYHGWLLYSSFILAKDKSPGLDPIYIGLYPVVIQEMTDHSVPLNPFHIASILNEIGKGLYSLVPWQADIAGILRQYREILPFHTNDLSYPLQGIAPTSYPHIQAVMDNLFSGKLKIVQRVNIPNGVVANYYSLTQKYAWYGLLFLLAFLSSLYILIYENPAFLAPITFFMANSFFLMVTRLVDNRYIVNLDVLLILQIALGVSCVIRRKYYAKQIFRQ